MSRDQLDQLLAEVRALREQTLAEFVGLTEEQFPLATPMHRWDDVRRVLLRFGDHMREHTTQIEGTRAAIGRAPTMPQRMLAQSELAWGALLASTVGLTDDDLAVVPPDGGWSLREVLEHVRTGERNYLNAIRAALGQPGSE